MPDAIGGYFGLELPAQGAAYHRDALCLQSGRSALQTALKALGVRRLWLPWFVCSAVAKAAAAAGTSLERYTQATLDRPPDIDPGIDEAVLVVNYFGLCGDAMDAYAARRPPGRVIIDACQAFFYRSPHPTVPAFYSPRKFFGVPDGGYLFPTPAAAPDIDPAGDSLSRTTHLLRRMLGDVRGGYGHYRAAEASLDTPDIRAMSAFTRDLLDRIDYAAAARRRRDNFAALHARFRDRNAWITLADGRGAAVPLCYPLLLDRPVATLRRQLAAADIFIPVYWPELADTLPRVARAERQWLTHVLALPCDQRYDSAAIDRLAAAVDSALR